jgi:hypothetical protein
MELRRKINGSTWTFKIVTAKQMKKQREKGEPEAGGLCVPSEKTIYIDKDCIDRDTICHELIHAYWSDLHLDDTNTVPLEDIEEIVAGMFTAKGEKINRQAKRITKDLLKLMEVKE